MKKIICFFKGHKRGNTWYSPWDKTWHIECKRYRKMIEYRSPRARLVGIEIRYGFDGS